MYNISEDQIGTFGKYTISGSLLKGNTIAIFRHFQVRKPRKCILSLPPTTLPKIPKNSSTTTIAALIHSIKHTAIATTTSTVRTKQESKNLPRISLGDAVLSDEKLSENRFVKPIDLPKGKPYFY